MILRRKLQIALYGSIGLVILVFTAFWLPGIIGVAVYPLNYKEIIKSYAAQRGLNPNLMAGLIYVESGFNPHAGSPAGARGLMQIMPQTGASIAAKIGEPYTADTLWDPEKNIKLGSWYLKFLIDKYHGDINLALIAYNGGVALADRYSASGGKLVLNPETGSYSAKVNAAKEIYDRIYGAWWEEKPPPPPNPVQRIIEAVVSNKPSVADLIKSLILGKYARK